MFLVVMRHSFHDVYVNVEQTIRKRWRNCEKSQETYIYSMWRIFQCVPVPVLVHVPSCWLSLSTQITHKHGNKYTLKIHFFRSTYSHSISGCLCSIRIPFFFFFSFWISREAGMHINIHIVLVSLTKWEVHSIFISIQLATGGCYKIHKLISSNGRFLASSVLCGKVRKCVVADKQRWNWTIIFSSYLVRQLMACCFRRRAYLAIVRDLR